MEELAETSCPFLQSRDGMRLMLCLGYVLSVVPVNDTMEYLQGLLAPYIQHLQQLTTAEVSTVL